MRLVIANRRYSSWSLRAWLAAKLTGTDFEGIVVPLRQPDTATRIRAFSPSGKVPVLIDGEAMVWESLAIVEHLAERFPEAGLWPRESSARAEARSIAAEMHAGFADLRRTYPMNLGRVGTPRSDGATAPDDVRRIEELWSAARRRHGGSGPFLFGAFSAADAMFAPVATRFLSYAVPLGPESAAYVAAVAGHSLMREWQEAAAAEPWTIAEFERL